jgi:hypothetical protein
MTLSASAVAACCCSASSRSRVSRATFVSLPAADEPRRPYSLRRNTALAPCRLATLRFGGFATCTGPPSHCRPSAQDKASWRGQTSTLVDGSSQLGWVRPMSHMGHFRPGQASRTFAHVRYVPKRKQVQGTRGSVTGRRGRMLSPGRGSSSRAGAVNATTLFLGKFKFERAACLYGAFGNLAALDTNLPLFALSILALSTPNARLFFKNWPVMKADPALFHL